MNKSKLRIVINYEGTHFYTIDGDYITKDDYLDLLEYCDRLSNYIKERLWVFTII